MSSHLCRFASQDELLATSNLCLHSLSCRALLFNLHPELSSPSSCIALISRHRNLKTLLAKLRWLVGQHKSTFLVKISGKLSKEFVVGRHAECKILRKGAADTQQHLPNTHQFLPSRLQVHLPTLLEKKPPQAHSLHIQHGVKE